MSKREKAVFTSSDGEKLSLYVIEQTRINDVRYILAEDALDSETAYIMKETYSDSDKEESVFEFVEDEQELDAISGVFAELLEDIDIEIV